MSGFQSPDVVIGASLGGAREVRCRPRTDKQNEYRCDWHEHGRISAAPMTARNVSRGTLGTQGGPYLKGILAHCRRPLRISVLEGNNNRIKVFKRMAYGYRDEAYFFLKIRAAFPEDLR